MRFWGGLIEAFVVLMFAVGWGVLELMTLRMDKKRNQRRAGAAEEKTRGG